MNTIINFDPIIAISRWVYSSSDFNYHRLWEVYQSFTSWTCGRLFNWASSSGKSGSSWARREGRDFDTCIYLQRVRFESTLNVAVGGWVARRPCQFVLLRFLIRRGFSRHLVVELVPMHWWGSLHGNLNLYVAWMGKWEWFEDLLVLSGVK